MHPDEGVRKLISEEDWQVDRSVPRTRIMQHCRQESIWSEEMATSALQHSFSAWHAERQPDSLLASAAAAPTIVM